MNNYIDIAIIGAGPYALSLAAHLNKAGIEYRIFGKTMEPWKTRMPPGMLLKSYPWASCLYDPEAEFTLKQFCEDHGCPYHDFSISIPLETFTLYGETFQKRFVPHVENKMLIDMDKSSVGFELLLDNGEQLSARKVVIAVGVHPFKYMPATVDFLPQEVVSHSGEYGSLENLSGKEVVVLGSGASATDLAASLYRHGSKVSLVTRKKALPFMPTPPSPKTQFQTLRKLASPIKPLKRLFSPQSCIGSTWLLKVCANAPNIFHRLPEKTRLEIVSNQLGPSGHWAIKDIVEKNIHQYLNRNLDATQLHNGKIILSLSSQNGSKETIQADHLIAATGYKIDLTQLDFLHKLLPDIRVVENAPILSSNYESSLSGLYFIGPASANSFGPITRFVCGGIHPARRITQHLKGTFKNQWSFYSSPTSVKTSPKSKSVSSLTVHAGQKLNILLISTMFRTPYRVLRCAQAAGAKVFILGTAGAKGLQSSKHCEAFFLTQNRIDGNLNEELAKQINLFISTHSIDQILAGDTASTRSLIAIRHLINAPCFPMPDLNSFDLLNNKWEFYQLCNELGIKCPHTQLFQITQAVVNEIKNGNYKFPLMAKPLSREAQIGVVKLATHTFEKQLEKISYQPIIIQDFIEGEDIGCSVFCKNGKILAFIAHKFRRYEYEFFFNPTIFNDIGKIVSHLRLDGIFNFDMRFTQEGEIFYLECNPRVFWKISMSMLAGINFISIGISNSENPFLIRPPSLPLKVRFPKSTLLHSVIAPWKLEKSSWRVLKFLYSDPLPYLRELGGLEKDAGGNYV